MFKINILYNFEYIQINFKILDIIRSCSVNQTPIIQYTFRYLYIYIYIYIYIRSNLSLGFLDQNQIKISDLDIMHNSIYEYQYSLLTSAFFYFLFL